MAIKSRIISMHCLDNTYNVFQSRGQTIGLSILRNSFANFRYRVPHYKSRCTVEYSVPLISDPCAFTVVSRSHDGRLAEANRDAAAANGTLEATARSHHAAQHSGVAGSDDKEPAEHVGTAIVDVPAVSRAAQRTACAVTHASAASNVDRHYRQQTHQLHCQCM